VTLRILWFAWFRTRVGAGEESVSPPDSVRDVRALVEWLARRSPGHAAALKEPAIVRVAVNQEYVKWDHPVRDGDEVAIFPPVTGG
jgi:molybdopterin synthase sulfur carrier subunit